MSKTTCISCKAVFGSLEKPLNLDIQPKHFQYFDSINRGGLIFPSNFLFNIVRKALSCFTNILLNDYSTAETEKVSTTKIARKLSKF